MVCLLAKCYPSEEAYKPSEAKDIQAGASWRLTAISCHMTQKSVREVLNELRWHPGRDASEARVFYRDRASEKGFVVIRADEMNELGPSSFTHRGSTIPYYKVFRVTYREEVLFEREESPSNQG